MSNPIVSNLGRQLWKPVEQGSEAQVYAILDSARDESVYPMLLESEAEFLCLFRGQMADDLADMAPYIVKLEQGTPFTQWLLNDGWGKSLGIFLESSSGLRELNNHFRALVTVYDKDGTPLYFRYYDPRVFRIYLPTCNIEELKTIFGPVSHYYVEGEEAEIAIEYSLSDSSTLIESMTRLDVVV